MPVKVIHDRDCDQWVDASVKPAICSCVKKELSEWALRVEELEQENDRLALDLNKLKLLKGGRIKK